MMDTVVFGDHVEFCVCEALSIEDVGRRVRDGLCAARQAGYECGSKPGVAAVHRGRRLR